MTNTERITANNAKLRETIEMANELSSDSEYDKFWDAFQDNGNRESYAFAFAGVCWNEKNFRPKYKIYPVNANYMFNSTQELPDLRGFDIDFSRCTAFGSCFAYAWIEHIGVVDTRATSGVGTAFQYATKLKTIEKLILRDDGSQTFTNTFAWAPLEHLMVEGKIGQNGFDLTYATKLSKESITSIVNALSTTANEKTLTLSELAVNNAFTEEEWNALTATKHNWTFALNK